MRYIDNNPRMIAVDSLAEMIEAMATHPDFAVVAWERPELANDTDGRWKALGQTVCGTGFNRRQIRYHHSEPVAWIKPRLEEAPGDGDPGGLVCGDPLYDWILQDYGTVFQAIQAHFGDKVFLNDDRLIEMSLNTYQTTDHNQRQEDAHIAAPEFHCDTPDYRLFCAYVGPATLFAAPEDVEEWVAEDSVDYPIMLARLKECARIHQLAPRSIAIFRGGPSPWDRPYYKEETYRHDLSKRLPHGAPRVDSEQYPQRVTMLGNITLTN